MSTRSTLDANFRVIYANGEAIGFMYRGTTFYASGYERDEPFRGKRLHNTIVSIARQLRPPLDFVAGEWKWIKGRGAVAVCPWPSPTLTVWDVIGEYVQIDGLRVQVLAVEHLRVESGVPQGRVGLRVRGLGTFCSVCNLPRFETADGPICPNGHSNTPPK